MKKFNLFLALVFLTAACKPSTETKINFGTQSSVSPTPTTPTPPVTSASVPLKLNISLKYDTTEWEVPWTFDHGTTDCEATTSAPQASCTVAVDEARLYRSTVIFRYSWFSDSCKIMQFRPYYYQAGELAASDLSWAGDDPVDCSAPLEQVNCWGGAAPTIVENFPKNRMIVYPPDESVVASPLNASVQIPSSWTRDYRSNRGVASDMSGDTTVNINGATLGQMWDETDPTPGTRDNYVANSFRPYKFECRDDWSDLQSYGISLFITDVDTISTPSNPPLNHFPSWKEQ